MGITMNQYFYGFFTAICLSFSFVMFTASKSSDLGDITVNSIRVVDNQNGGFITTYNRLGELTTFIGGLKMVVERLHPMIRTKFNIQFGVLRTKVGNKMKNC